MKSKKSKRIIIACLIIMIAAGACFGFYKYRQHLALIEEEKQRETLYAASEDYTLVIERRDGEATLTIVRGTPVEARVKPLVIETDAGEETVRLVYIDDEEYLMHDDQLVHDYKDSVKETNGYVSLPAVLYEKPDGPEIKASVEKNTEVQIIGFASLLEDGSVGRYLVNDGTSQGYIRSSYIVRNKEDVIDTAADFQYEREDIYGGGSAYTLEYPDLAKGDFVNNPMPRECRTLYLNKVSIQYIDDYIEIANNSGINAFIIDIKESNGPAYESEVIREYSPTSYEYAYNTAQDYQAAIAKCKEAGIYVIGRIVAFKDDLYPIDHPECVLMDNETGEPYVLGYSCWPSPYQRKVWEYNIKLAVEAVEQMGFNEINFDYVRFPDGLMYDIDHIDFRNAYNESMAQAINRFLLYARDELHDAGVYMSIDVFGETSNDYVTAYGQYWPMMSNIADVMCAMPYPDHFWIHDYGIEQAVWEVPYTLLYYWGTYVNLRQAETPAPAKVRTWIQGFDTLYKEPVVEYTVDQINDQIEGLYANGLNDGYMVWNAPSEVWRYWSYVPAFYERINE